jgi:hypothetical protein
MEIPRQSGISDSQMQAMHASYQVPLDVQVGMPGNNPNVKLKDPRSPR